MKTQTSDFYAGGSFHVEQARTAYFDMMKRFNYPISEKLRNEMWATDFQLGDFTNVGMGGIFWVNKQTEGYFAHEIFLLPGQMIVEHGHEACGSCGAKHESWHVRHGSIYTFGEEGQPLDTLPVRIPESQKDNVTVSKCALVKQGEIAELNRKTAKHFMIAGPEGAIVTEYGTFHDNDGLRFTNPEVKF
jgi:hypothetical protein